jgi:hypothetical protein
LDHRQNVAAKFAHLAVVFLDHPDPAGDFEGTRRLFEDSYLWHRPGHRDDFLPSVIRDQKVGRRAQLARQRQFTGDAEGVEGPANLVERNAELVIPNPLKGF